MGFVEFVKRLNSNGRATKSQELLFDGQRPCSAIFFFAGLMLTSVFHPSEEIPE
jgi:hypothetical protein